MNYSNIELLIKNKLSVDIPSLLLTAGLPAIDQFVQGRPLQIDDNELCVYLADGNNNGERDSCLFIIQLQLNSISHFTPYNDILYEYLFDNITVQLLGFTERDYIGYDIWPMESTGFIYYELSFYNQLDDCN